MRLGDDSQSAMIFFKVIYPQMVGVNSSKADSMKNSSLKPRMYPIAVFVACVLVASSGNAAVKSSVHHAPVVQRPAWELPEDAEAKTYLSVCEAEFNKLASELDGFTESTSVTDKDLLDKLNRMDMISDVQMFR